MKRLLFMFIAIFVFTASIFAQFPPIFNLEQGKKYTVQEALDAVGSSAIKETHDIESYEESAESKEFSINLYPKIEGSLPGYSLGFLDTGEYYSCLEIYERDTYIVADGDTLRGDARYKYLYKSLSSKYEMKKDSDECAYYEDGLFSMEIGNNDGQIIIVYEDNTPQFNKFLKDARPEIQTSFLGLKLRDKYSDYEIRNALTERGTFSSSKRTSTGKKFLAQKVSFGGQLWDFCTISTDYEGRILIFNVYNSNDNNFIGQKKSDELYKELEGQLDKKYIVIPDFIKEKSDMAGWTKLIKMTNESEILYFGKNSVVLELYKKLEKSSGGEFRRYVGLNYIDRDVLNNTVDNVNDEL